MFTVNNEDTSVLILNVNVETVFKPCSCALVANVEQVIVCWEGLYQKHIYDYDYTRTYTKLKIYKNESCLICVKTVSSYTILK